MKRTPSLLSIAQLNVSHWRTQLLRSAIPAKSIYICGSLATGLAIGPKPLAYSAFDDHGLTGRVVEIDARIILNPGFDPLNAILLHAISDVVGATLRDAKTIQRWGRTIPQASLYLRTPWAAGVHLEWDISVNVEPYFETAPWWSLAFSPAEIMAQRQLRRSAVDTAVPQDTYEALKTMQSRELRWRLCLGLSRPNTVPEGSPFDALKSMLHTNPVLAASTAAAKLGQVQRPDARAIMGELHNHGVVLPEPPSPPAWVRLMIEQNDEHKP
jgi:hypothetical protein